MRTTLLLSAATLALAVAGAPIAAHAQASAPTDRSDFNTGGPGQTNAERPTGTSSKLGKPASARSRTAPGGTPSTGRHAAEPGHTLDAQSLNTSGPGVTTSPNNARSVTRPTTTPQALRAASHPGDSTTTGKQPATSATQTAPGFNTGGPAETNETNPTAPSAKLH